MMPPLAPSAPDRVCVVIGRTRHKMMQLELEESVKRGAKFLELRLDFLAKAIDFARLAEFKRVPWLATVRRAADGGRYGRPESERLTILRQCIAGGHFEWVDLESDIAASIRRFGSVRRLISHHDFKQTPDDLGDIYKRMLDLDGDCYKLAVTANTPRDCARVLELLAGAPKPTIAFCMGDIGFPTRLLSLKYGSPWTYAAFNRERGLAPGLPTFDELRTTYPAHRIGPNTKVFGLLGDPVAHSFSPLVHNRAFGEMNEDAVYLPFRAPPGQLAETLAAYQTVPVEGYSVTIPHKEEAANLAAEREPFVETSGAANTLVRRPDGRFRAHNTDGRAALEAYEDRESPAHRPDSDEEPAGQSPAGADLFAGTSLSSAASPEPRGLPAPPAKSDKHFVLILGAGGAARAVALAFIQNGAAVTVTSRDPARGQKLAADLGCKSCDWAARHNQISTDILVNCTPVGMHPKTGESPIHASFLKQGLTVFETIYHPEQTMLVREAKERGCTVVSGVEMFVRQAARQLELFTGEQPTLEPMRRLVRKALSPLTKALDDE